MYLCELISQYHASKSIQSIRLPPTQSMMPPVTTNSTPPAIPKRMSPATTVIRRPLVPSGLKDEIGEAVGVVRGRAKGNGDVAGGSKVSVGVASVGVASPIVAVAEGGAATTRGEATVAVDEAA